MTSVVAFFYHDGRVDKLAVFMTWALGGALFSIFFPDASLLWVQSLAFLAVVCLGWRAIDTVYDLKKGEIFDSDGRSNIMKVIGFPMFTGVCLLIFSQTTGSIVFVGFAYHLMFLFFAVPFLGLAIANRKEKEKFWAALFFGVIFLLGFVLGPSSNTPR